MISKSLTNLNKAIKEHQNIFSNLEKNIDIINSSINLIYKKIKKGGKIVFCGNGGSAADAQHLAAELLVRLRPKKNRRPIAALALAMDTSTIANALTRRDLLMKARSNVQNISAQRVVRYVISVSMRTCAMEDKEERRQRDW